VLVRAGGALETLSYRGPVIGSGSDSPYGQKELRLEPGDKIILYTDGLTENRGREGRPFGRDLFYSILREFGRSPVEELVGGLHAKVQAFLKGVRPDDDISLLGVEYTGAAARPFAI